MREALLFNECFVESDAQVRLGSVVEHQHQGTADTAERISNESFVEAGDNALLRCELLQAISNALVDVLHNWLFCLHLETPCLSVLRKRGGE